VAGVDGRGIHMAGHTDISFTSDGLRHGGRMASSTADAAGAVARQIAVIQIDAAAFGQLPATASLGTALSAFRDGHAELSRQVEAAHADLAGRAGGVAVDGDGMVQDTAATAGAVPGYAP
jgi:hypothetical protein